jgi:hypothetical protein
MTYSCLRGGYHHIFTIQFLSRQVKEAVEMSEYSKLLENAIENDGKILAERKAAKVQERAEAFEAEAQKIAQEYLSGLKIGNWAMQSTSGKWFKEDFDGLDERVAEIISQQINDDSYVIGCENFRRSVNMEKADPRRYDYLLHIDKDRRHRSSFGYEGVWIYAIPKLKLTNKVSERDLVEKYYIDNFLKKYYDTDLAKDKEELAEIKQWKKECHERERCSASNSGCAVYFVIGAIGIAAGAVIVGNFVV